MTSYIIKHCRLFSIGTLFFLTGLFSQNATAQCDFINDITGIVLSTPPAGDAANPVLYTQTYVLVDNQGNIFATGITPDFLGVPPGFYNLYAVNYDNTEALAVLPLLIVGQPWFNVETYGNDDVNNCLDYSLPFGSGCPIVVCDQMDICEISTLNTLSLNFETVDHSQTYCLVCNDVVQAIEASGSFPLSNYPAAVSGADCQLFGLNYNTNAGVPINVGATWTTTMDAECANSCVDFIGMDLNITPITQPSGNGISTTADWWDTSDGCGGAQTSTNGGLDFLEVVNNWCVPSYNPSPINARPVGGNTTSSDDLEALMGSNMFHSRVPCVGTMDLTQNPVFYTVECATGGPSVLNVLVSNAGPGITQVQAALYGPVNSACPSFSGGSFVDCNDVGAGSNSGLPMGPMTLTTNGNPGETYLVIVDTEGTEEFTISSLNVLLNNKLVSFTGTKEEENNLLAWVVEDEKQISHYVLERSNDGVSFFPINQQEGLNSGNALTNYSYTDELAGSGTKYYRLKSVNNDGSFEYSNIVVLSRDEEDFGISIYPNPTKGSFYIEFESTMGTSIDYEIQDIIGQTVQKGSDKVQVGLNKFELSMENYPSATYIVSLTINGQRIQRKLIKD